MLDSAMRSRHTRTPPWSYDNAKCSGALHFVEWLYATARQGAAAAGCQEHVVMPNLELGLGSDVAAAWLQLRPSSLDRDANTAPVPVRNSIKMSSVSATCCTVFSISHVDANRTCPRASHERPLS